MISLKLEKSVYINGDIAVIVSSNSWRLMQDTRILKMEVSIGVLPTGTGSTIVRAIRNNDTEDVLYAVEFTAGGQLILTDTAEKLIDAGDTIQITIPQIADTTSGQDLLIQFLYHSL